MIIIIIIVMEFLVTVLSITYFTNIFWGWTVPLSPGQIYVYLIHTQIIYEILDWVDWLSIIYVS